MSNMNKSNRKPKAYENLQFLKGPTGREIRILSEFIEPFSRFRKERITDTIVFFGSARVQPLNEAKADLKSIESKIKKNKKPNKKLFEKYEQMKVAFQMSKYYEEAYQLSYLLTNWAKTLNHGHRFVICSGGGPGIMEAANRGATKSGGKSIGLNISLPHEQLPNSFITEELNFEFHYFFMRKFWFMYLAKAMVIFPGGFGTMDEMMEVLTLLQSGKIKKNLALVLYGTDYWTKIINFPEMIRLGVISKEDMKIFKFCDSPEETFDYLKTEITKNVLARKAISL
jgi:uncharacterized protein (TIGR00730 family)